MLADVMFHQGIKWIQPKCDCCQIWIFLHSIIILMIVYLKLCLNPIL